MTPADIGPPRPTFIEALVAIASGLLLLSVALTTFRYAATGEGGSAPRLTLRVSPVMAMSDPGTGGAVVTIYARIEGEVTEEWYCPEAVFLWPDGTKASRESDCEAWSEGEEGETRWSMSRRIPPSPDVGWSVVVELRKSGRLIAREVAVVRVVG